MTGTTDGGALGDWEIERGTTWELVPAARIARVRLEREALSEYARLARTLGESSAGPRAPAAYDLARRTELATWLAREGLLPELVKELDRVLAADPDHARALALLRDRSLADLLPPLPSSGDANELASARSRAMREGAKATPAMRELWIARLGELARPRVAPASDPALGLRALESVASDAERAALLAKLASELDQGVDVRRAFAAQAMRRLFPAAMGTELARLERLATSDRSRDARDEARRALRDARDPSVVTHLVPEIVATTLRERVGAIDALGVAGYDAAIEPLVTHLADVASSFAAGGGGGTVPRSHVSVRNIVAYTQDYDVEIAQGASIADPIVNFAEEGTVLDVAAATWQLPLPVQFENAITVRALARITGDASKRTPQAWIDWWKDERARRAAAQSSSDAPSTPPPRRDG